VWLDGRTIDSFTKPNFSSGRTSNFDHQILTSTKQLNQQRLSADGILIPHLRQALIVNGNFMKPLLTILFFILAISSRGQIKCGIFQYNSSSKNTILEEDFSNLSITKDSSFTYKYRTSDGCLIWFDILGKWQVKNDTLILIDSVETFEGKIISTNTNNLLIAAGRPVFTDQNIRYFVQRRTLFKIQDSSLSISYLTQEFDKKFGIPLRQISGNFRHVD